MHGKAIESAIKRKVGAGLLNLEKDALGVAVELGGAHALDLRDAALVTAFELHAGGVLEDVGALCQVVDEEVAGGVASAFVVAAAVLVVVAAEHVNRLGIVSRGVGIAALPVRFRVPPEIGLFTLRRAQ